MYRLVCVAGSHANTRLAAPSESAVEVEGSADEGQMGEGLREVSQRLAAGSDLLGVETEVVGVAQHLLEDKPSFFQPSCAGERLHEPECAQAERAFLPHEAVRRHPDVVAEDEAVGDKPIVFRRAIDGVKRAEHPRTFGGHEEHQGHDQVGGVQRVVIISLHERLALRAPPPFHDLLVDLVAHLKPPLAVGWKRALIGQPQGSVQGDPAHELRVHEVPPSTSNLPDSLIFASPVVADPVDQPAQVSPQLVPDGVAVLVVEIDRVHQLAVDVQLQLVVGTVADPDRPRAPVALQVLQGLLGEVAPPIYAVHELQRAVWSRLAAAVLEPAHERLSLLGEPDAQETVEGEGGVTDPRVTVTPVALPSYTLRQAGRGGRNDRPGRLVSEKLQHEGRAVNHLAPAARIRALREPVAPIVHGLHEKLFFGPRKGNAACGSWIYFSEHEYR